MISTVGVPAGGGESVGPVVDARVAVGSSVAVAAAVGVAALVAFADGSAAIAEGVGVGMAAWAHAISSSVANDPRTNQRPIFPSEWI